MYVFKALGVRCRARGSGTKFTFTSDPIKSPCITAVVFVAPIRGFQVCLGEGTPKL